METIKSKLAKGGFLLVALGAISIILSLFNYDIRLFSWMDLWGNTMGWVLRILSIVGGCFLLFFFEMEEIDT